MADRKSKRRSHRAARPKGTLGRDLSRLAITVNELPDTKHQRRQALAAGSVPVRQRTNAREDRHKPCPYDLRDDWRPEDVAAHYAGKASYSLDFSCGIHAGMRIYSSYKGLRK